MGSTLGREVTGLGPREVLLTNWVPRSDVKCVTPQHYWPAAKSAAHSPMRWSELEAATKPQYSHAENPGLNRAV